MFPRIRHISIYNDNLNTFLLLYLIGYPNVCPFLTKAKKAAVLQIKPIAAKIVSIVSRTKTAVLLKYKDNIQNYF